MSRLIVVVGCLFAVLSDVGGFSRPPTGALRWQQSASLFVAQDRQSSISNMDGGSKWVKISDYRASDDASIRRKGQLKAVSSVKKKKQKPLVERRGSRPLTKKELKKKEQRDVLEGPRVQRSIAPADRVPLSDLSSGEKRRGRIIKIEKFGMFVDIGSKKDGLVHVKDVSNDYFMQNLETQFRPGQDISVWIKYVDPESMKLALQMYPPDSSSSSALSDVRSPQPARTRSITSFQEEEEVEGVVTRVSSYGVYVNIGSNVDAFLHRRKMRIGRRKRSFKTWEIHPVGSSIHGYIHSVDKDRKRLAMTTYAPEKWDSMLPDVSEIVGNMYEEDEERGGSVRAANLEALQNTLALTLDDERHGDEYDDEEDMSAAELARAMALEDARLMQEDEDEDAQNDYNDEVPSTLRGDIIKPQGDMSVDDLFSELSGGQGFVTVRDVMRWDFVEELVREGEMDEYFLADSFRQCGAKNGKLREEAFDSLVGLLAEATGSEEVYDDEAASLLEKRTNEVAARARELPSIQVLLDDHNDNGYLMTFDDDDNSDDFMREDMNGLNAEAEDDMGMLDRLNVNMDWSNSKDDGGAQQSLGMDSLASPRIGEEAILTQAMKSSGMGVTSMDARNMMKVVFDSVCSVPGRATLTDVLEWDFTIDMMANKAITKLDVTAIFDFARGSDDHLSPSSFEVFVERFSELESLSRDSSTWTEDQESIPEFPFAEDEGEDWKSTEEVFAELSQDGGVSVTLKDLRGWSVVTELVEAGVVALDGPSRSIASLFLEAGGDDGRMDLIAFESFVDLLLPFAAEDEPEGDEGDYSLEDLQTPLKASEASGSDEDDTDESALLQEVFFSLAGDKGFVSTKDMMRWDLVLELIGEGLLSEEQLQSMVHGVASSKMSKKGLNISEFDMLIDSLLGLYESESKHDSILLSDDCASGVEEDDIDGDDPTRLDAHDVVDRLPGDYDDNDGGYLHEGEILTLGDEGEYFDVDTDAVFEDVACGKDYVTMEDLQSWELIGALKAQGALTNEELAALLEVAGVQQRGDGENIRMEKLDFEAFLEALAEGDQDILDEGQGQGEGDRV